MLFFMYKENNILHTHEVIIDKGWHRQHFLRVVPHIREIRSCSYTPGFPIGIVSS
jgi:hypothetical protein